jgi:hypothetical protein
MELDVTDGAPAEIDERVKRLTESVALDVGSVVGSGGISGMPITLLVMVGRLVLSGPGGVGSLVTGGLSERVDMEGSWEGDDVCG